MLVSYKKGEMITPADLASLASIANNVSEKYQVDNVGCMLAAADAIGLTYEECTIMDILPQLEVRKKVIALVNASSYLQD